MLYSNCNGQPDPWGICDCGECQPLEILIPLDSPAVGFLRSPLPAPAPMYGHYDPAWSQYMSEGYAVRHDDLSGGHMHWPTWTDPDMCALCSGAMDPAILPEQAHERRITLVCARQFTEETDDEDPIDMPCHWCDATSRRTCPCDCHADFHDRYEDDGEGEIGG